MAKECLLKTIRCTSCYEEFGDADIVRATSCPSCGSNSLPMWIRDDVILRLNPVDLAVLAELATDWAEAQVDECGRSTLMNILARAGEHRPDGAWEHDDFDVPINWHEVRIIANWAWMQATAIAQEDPYSDQVSVLESILDKIRPIRPEDACALTLPEEVREAQEKFPNISLHMGDEEIVSMTDVTEGSDHS